MVNFSMTWFSWHVCFALKIFSMGYVHHYQYEYVHWYDHVMISTQVLYTHKVVNHIARRHYPEEQKNHIHIQSWVWLANLSCWPLLTLGDPWWPLRLFYSNAYLTRLEELTRENSLGFTFPQTGGRALRTWSICLATGEMINIFQHVSTHPRFVTKHQQCQCIFVADMVCCNGVCVVVGHRCPVFCGELARLRKRIA